MLFKAMPGPLDIPDIPDPSATEAPKQFGSAVQEILEPGVFEPIPEEPSPTEAPRPQPAPITPVAPVAPVAAAVSPAEVLPEPASENDEEGGASLLLQIALFLGVVVAVAVVVVSVAFGAAVLFGLVVGIALR